MIKMLLCSEEKQPLRSFVDAKSCVRACVRVGVCVFLKILLNTDEAAEETSYGDPAVGCFFLQLPLISHNECCH